MFATEIRKKRVAHLRRFPQWRWHLDEVFVKINGKLRYLWRAVDHQNPCDREHRIHVAGRWRRSDKNFHVILFTL
jgi:transposase-like protein